MGVSILPIKPGPMGWLGVGGSGDWGDVAGGWYRVINGPQSPADEGPITAFSGHQPAAKSGLYGDFHRAGRGSEGGCVGANSSRSSFHHMIHPVRLSFHHPMFSCREDDPKRAGNRFILASPVVPVPLSSLPLRGDLFSRSVRFSTDVGRSLFMGDSLPLHV